MNPTNISIKATLVLISLVLDMTQGIATAGWGSPNPILNPKTYASPSKKCELFVNPSDLHGCGKGTYRLMLDGKELWSGEKSYTLYEAKVADDGVVTGYAYSQGFEGFSKAGPQAGMGDFRVVILDPGGKERLNLATKREDSHFPHQLPNPTASGLLMDEANDRVVFRVSDDDINRQAESWWVYELSTGREEARLRPKELMPNPAPVRYIMEAKLVEGTPLILLHWWRYHWEKEQKQGARFTLVDLDGKSIWSSDLVDDYEIPGDDQAEARLIRSLHRGGGVLEPNKPGRFDLRFVKDAQRVTFEVARAPTGTWVVSEVERRPFVEPAVQKPKLPEIPILALRPTATIVLKSPSTGPAPEIRSVRDFEFDASGRIAFIRGLEDGSMTLMVIDQQGKILHKVPLDPSHAENRNGWSDMTCVDTGRYLMIRDNPNNRDVMEGAIVDVGAGKTVPIPGFATSVLAKVAGFPDGGFVVKGGLTYFRGGCTGDETLKFFDGQGRKLRELQGFGDFKDINSFYGSPRDLTVTTNGMIATLDGSRNLVQFFDRNGKHHHTIELEKAWRRKPNYLSEIAADRDGGVVVEDFLGDHPLVRMNVDGTVRSKLRPKLADGRTFSLSDFKVSPDGALWVSDGHALYRLDESGVVVQTLGSAPDPQKLDKVAAVTIDGKGRIYAVVARTGAVHVFDQDGRWLRACLPGGDDVAEELSLTQITVSNSGDIYLDVGSVVNHKYLHFLPDGKRSGIEKAKLDNISEKWYVQPGTGQRWVLGYEKVFLVNSAGAVIRTILRRPDNSWLVNPETASVAADGSIAIVSKDLGSMGGGEVSVNLYSSQGDPIRTITLPHLVEWSFPRIAYNGNRLVVVDGKTIACFDATGNLIGLIPPLLDSAAWWTPFLDREGRKLSLFDGERTVRNFELP